MDSIPLMQWHACCSTDIFYPICKSFDMGIGDCVRVVRACVRVCACV